MCNITATRSSRNEICMIIIQFVKRVSVLYYLALEVVVALNTSMYSLTLPQVADWLDTQGLSAYRQIFIENEINGENLLELGKVVF